MRAAFEGTYSWGEEEADVTLITIGTEGVRPPRQRYTGVC